MSSTDTALRGSLGLGLGGTTEVSKWRFSGQLLLALIFLNSTLCFSAIWPTVYVLPDLGVSPEFVCLIMLLSAWVAVFGKPSVRALGILSAVYLLMAFGHYADVVVPNLLGRPVNLYSGAVEQLVPRVAVCRVRDSTSARCVFKSRCGLGGHPLLPIAVHIAPWCNPCHLLAVQKTTECAHTGAGW